jgi:nucleoside-triphosphatase THEP1
VHSTWRKAALLGGLWASLEIILGSFLHNLRVPMSGMMLSAIGVVLLSAGYQRWPVPGLLWRAGLICAVMKSMSPSAIILGPMVGIFMEGLLMEIGTRLFFGSALGCLLGGALAVGATLVQKAINLLITFGFDIVDLYLRLYELAARNLGVISLGPVDLLLLFLLVHIATGVMAAAMGIMVGRQAGKSPAAALGHGLAGGHRLDFHSPANQLFAPTLLLLNCLFLVSVLFLLDRIGLGLATGITLGYIVLAAGRYRSSLRRLRRPSMLIQIVLVMVLSGFLLGSLQNAEWSLSGLVIGFRMSLRAALVIVAFSIMGYELRNPVLLAWFSRRGGEMFVGALETAFEALPTLTRSVARQRQTWRNPLQSAARLIRELEALVDTDDAREQVRFLILTGAMEQGKTSCARALAGRLRKKGCRVAGILAEGLWNGSQRSGFDLIDLASGRRVPLCRAKESSSGVRIGRFVFREEGLVLGNTALKRAAQDAADLVMLDEIGPLELQGQGWAAGLSELRWQTEVPLLLVVRKSLIDDVLARWSLRPCRVFEVAPGNLEEVIEQLERHSIGLRSCDTARLGVRT